MYDIYDLDKRNNIKMMKLIIQGDLEKAEKYKLRMIKFQNIWKFDKPENDRFDTLERNELYLSDPNNFVDQKDCLGTICNYEMIKSYLKENGINKELSELESIVEKMFRDLKSKVKVCCFSKWMLSKELWESSANNFEGFVVHYDFSKLSDDNIFFNDLYPVIYSDNYLDITSIIKNYFGEKDSFKFITIAFFQYLFKNKSEYSHEREIRIVDFKNDKYIKAPCKPEEIITGINISKKSKDRLESIAKLLDCPIRPLENRRFFQKGGEYAYDQNKH